jgi:hypothetical protein
MGSDTVTGLEDRPTAQGFRRGHQTQWAAQFAVASELCKRGYEVSFTMGNATPLADLMVVSPLKREMFLIDVKGLYRKNPWLVKRHPPRQNLFYVLAYVPTGRFDRCSGIEAFGASTSLSMWLTSSEPPRFDRRSHALTQIGRISSSHRCWPPSQPIPSQHLESEPNRFENPNASPARLQSSTGSRRAGSSEFDMSIHCLT